MFDHAPPTAGEVRALAHQLLSWAEQLSAMPAPTSALSEEDRHELALAQAEAARREARLRARIFAGVPFGNANWDVLLELYIREMMGFRVSLDDLVAENLLPRELVVRCVDALEELGLVEKVSDRFDRRVNWLVLSAAAKQGMTRLLLESARTVRPRHDSPTSAGRTVRGEKDGGLPLSRSA